MHNLRYEGSCFFSKQLRVTPLSPANGTNYNRGSRLVRSPFGKKKYLTTAKRPLDGIHVATNQSRTIPISVYVKNV
jgi:hypothetical protein